MVAVVSFGHVDPPHLRMVQACGTPGEAEQQRTNASIKYSDPRWNEIGQRPPVRGAPNPLGNRPFQSLQANQRNDAGEKDGSEQQPERQSGSGAHITTLPVARASLHLLKRGGDRG